MPGKLIIFSAPSGSGKTTIVNHLVLIKELNLEFSISACTRKKRDGETDGKDYYFLSVDEFRMKIEENAFIEWEEVYKNHYYGTLKYEVERIREDNRNVIFDVDVMGGISLKKQYKDQALSVFIMPPSTDELKRRLESRGTDPVEKIEGRLKKAEFEMKYAKQFDKIIVNDKLEKALEEAEQIIRQFLSN